MKPILGCVAFFILVVVYREPETRQTFRSFVQAWQKGIGLAFQTPESVFENKFRQAKKYENFVEKVLI